jgi:PilZ domain
VISNKWRANSVSVDHEIVEAIRAERSMNEFDERRNDVRKKVMKFTPVYDLDKGSLLGYLRDLTLKGALVIGEKTMAVDTQTRLAIELPGDIPGITNKRLTISARVARCVDDEGPNSYQLGFEFIDITPEQIQVIEALLERYHFRHRRYKLQDPGAI